MPKHLSVRRLSYFADPRSVVATGGHHSISRSPGILFTTLGIKLNWQGYHVLKSPGKKKKSRDSHLAQQLPQRFAGREGRRVREESRPGAADSPQPKTCRTHARPHVDDKPRAPRLAPISARQPQTWPSRDRAADTQERPGRATLRRGGLPRQRMRQSMPPSRCSTAPCTLPPLRLSAATLRSKS